MKTLLYPVVQVLALFLVGCATNETREHLAARHACEAEALNAHASIQLQARLYKDCMRLKGMTP